MKKLAFVLGGLLSMSSIAQMTTIGNAVQFGGCDCYQLVTENTAQRGAIWSPQSIDLTNNFDMTFNVFLGDNGIWGADGLGFVLQQNPTGLGDIGAGMGFGLPYSPTPISASNLAIELDVYDNGASVPTDLTSDHIAINSNGSKDHNLVAPVVFPGNQEIGDNAYHEFRVQWDANLQILAAYWEGAGAPIIFLSNDIVTSIFGGNPNVYWGFTASTGGIVAEMRVCHVSTSTFSTDLTSVCPGLPIQFTDGSVTDVGINSWSWDFGDGSSLGTSQNPSYSYQAPGSYTAELTMTDGFGCAYVTTTAITVLDSVTLNMDSTGVTCYGDTDGTGTAVPTNGSGPYSYAWTSTPAQNAQVATGLDPGLYTVTVTDNLGCIGIETISVGEPAEFLLDLSGNDIVCFADSTGDVTVTTINGVSTFNYSWNDYLTQNSATATNLPAGTYTVTVTDSDGCIAIDSLEIFEGSEIVVTGITTNDDGSGSGSIDITVSGGASPYVYSWNNGETTEDLSNLPAGFYTVIVTDDNNCTKEVVFEVKGSVGVNTFEEIGFKIFPNPSNGQFIIQGIGAYQITILDLSGQELYNDFSSGNTEVNLLDLSSGMYVLRLKIDGLVYLNKLIIE